MYTKYIIKIPFAQFRLDSKIIPFLLFSKGINSLTERKMVPIPCKSSGKET